MKRISILTAAILAVTISSCEEENIDSTVQNEVSSEETSTSTEVSVETEGTITSEEENTQTTDEDSTIAIVDSREEVSSNNLNDVETDDFDGVTGSERSSSLEETVNEDGQTVTRGSVRNTVTATNINGTDVVAPESTNTDPASIVMDIQTLVNNHRDSVGANALILDQFISNLAVEHSRNVAMGTATALDGFNGRQTAVSSQFISIGDYGENTAENQTNGSGAVAQWLNTPRQREDIENAAFTHTGIGSYQNPDTGIIYYTQILVEIN